MVKRSEVTHFGGVGSPREATDRTPTVPAETGTAPAREAEVGSAQPPPVQGSGAKLRPATLTQVQALEAKLRRMVQQVTVEIPQKIVAERARMEQARSVIASTADRLEERRSARQLLLVEGGDVAAVTREIADIRAEQDLAEDLVQGLEAKLAALETENVRLQVEEKPRVQHELFDLSIQPLVDEYNMAAARLAELTEAVYRRALECGVGFSRGTVGTVWPSSWEGFDTVPRLCRPGEAGGHFFHHPWFAYRIQEEMRTAQQD